MNIKERAAKALKELLGCYDVPRTACINARNALEELQADVKAANSRGLESSKEVTRRIFAGEADFKPNGEFVIKGTKEQFDAWVEALIEKRSTLSKAMLKEIHLG